MTSTFILGIDGGTWRVLDEYDLPAFDRIASEGISGTTRSTYPPITFPAWKCYSTGKNPGRLGVFGFSNFDRTQHRNRQNDATHFKSAELWDYISDEGGTVDVVNMPTTYPAHDVNGVMIAGPNSGESGYVEPVEREDEIESYGYQPLTSGHRLAFKNGGEKAVTAATEIIESRFETTRRLLEEDSPDLCNLTLYCTDTIQHYYWMEEELRDVYEVVNRELETLLDQLAADSEEWNVVVLSDHGFQPIRGAFYFDSWLEQEGFLTRTQSTGTDSSIKERLGLTTENAYSVIQKLGLEGVIGRLPDTLVKRAGQELAGGISVVDAVDWDQSDVVFLHGGLFVLDTDRREQIIDSLTTALTSVTDEHGDRVIDDVVRSEDVYEGEYTPLGPDVIPISSTYKLLGFSGDDGLFDPDDDWIAGHEMDGVWLASGPDFGTGDDVSVDLYDIAPTVLHAMGYAVPDDVDGDVRSDVLSESRAVSAREPLPPAHGTALDDADKARVNERLQQLGYMN